MIPADVLLDIINDTTHEVGTPHSRHRSSTSSSDERKSIRDYIHRYIDKENTKFITILLALIIIIIKLFV